MYACIYLDRYNDEIPCARRLLSFCMDNGCGIAGNYLCEALTEFNVFGSEHRNMFLRLQASVHFCKGVDPHVR